MREATTMTYWVIMPLPGKTRKVPVVIVRQETRPRFGSKEVRGVREGDMMSFETIDDVIDHLNRWEVPNEMRPVEFWQ